MILSSKSAKPSLTPKSCPYRITSYNVCYTKLLRLILRKDIIDGIRSLQNPGEPDILNELVDAYLKDVDENLRNLQIEMLNKNFEEVKRWLHRIKGASANLGAVSLVNQIVVMEEITLSEDIELLNQNITPLYVKLEEFKQCLLEEKTNFLI